MSNAQKLSQAVAGGVDPVKTNVAQSWTAQQTFTGNLILSSGQIKFPATQNASADANTLDDYEEGTFTPTITFGGAAVGVTYTSNSGSYTKIGNSVRINFTLGLSSKGSSTGVMAISGLPFTASASYQLFCSGALSGQTSGVGDTALSFRVTAGTAACTAFKSIGGGLTQLADTDYTNSTITFINATYIV